MTKDIFVGIRIDNINPWFNKHVSCITNLGYPKDNLRFVYSVKESVYAKTVAEKLKEVRDLNKLNMEVYLEPQDANLQKYGAEMGASIFNDWKKLFKEDYFLLLDSDIVMLPSFSIHEMLRIDEAIVSPYLFMEYSDVFYDTFKFRINGRMIHPNATPGIGLLTPVKMDSVGGCMLVKGKVFSEVEIDNPYPTIGLCANAYRKGYRTVALPYIRAVHENLTNYKIYHYPLPKEFGRMPIDNNFYSDINKVETLPIEPMHSTSELIQYLTGIDEAYVKYIETQASNMYNNDKVLQAEKSLKWTFNILKFYNYYFTRDPLKLMYYYYLEPLPEWFEFEATTACNFKCPMCEHTHWKEKPQHMSFNMFKTITDQFTNLKWVGASGIGESFLNPEYVKMLKYIKDKDKDVYIEFFDQFFLQDKAKLKEWVDYSFDKVYISMDGATEETYMKQRPGSNYDKVIDNIKLLDSIKKDEGKHYPRFCSHYIINRDNVHEAADYLRLLSDMDVSVWFVQYSKVLHNYDAIKGMQVNITQEVINDIQKASKETGIEARFNINSSDVGNKRSMYGCSAYTQPFIFVDGNVIPCCACNEQNDRPYQIKTSLGNLTTQSLKDVWYGDRAREYRKNLYTGKLDDVCKRCPLFNRRSVMKC